MPSEIDDLVKMGDIDTLHDLLDDDDWMTQLDAAEGLVKLGDKRGLEFLISATGSEDREIRQVAKEILDSPELLRRREELEAEERREHERKVEVGRKRLQQGQKVFRYKMVYLPAGDILDEDALGEGFDVPALTDHGLEGWEVVGIIPRRKQSLVSMVDENYSGAYFLLKKEVAEGEEGDLDRL